MQIGEMADATGLSRDTLRFYEKRGLLHSRRTSNGYRQYPPEAVEWLCYMRTAQALGFSLKEIEADMPLLLAAETSAPQLRTVLERKLTELDDRIAGLVALRGDLAARLDQSLGDCPLRAGVQASTGKVTRIA